MRQSWQHILKAQQQQEAYVLRVKSVGFFFSAKDNNFFSFFFFPFSK